MSIELGLGTLVDAFRAFAARLVVDTAARVSPAFETSAPYCAWMAPLCVSPISEFLNCLELLGDIDIWRTVQCVEVGGDQKIAVARSSSSSPCNFMITGLPAKGCWSSSSLVRLLADKLVTSPPVRPPRVMFAIMGRPAA